MINTLLKYDIKQKSFEFDCNYGNYDTTRRINELYLLFITHSHFITFKLN